MQSFIQGVLNNIGCSGSYCQEYESNGENKISVDRYKGWNLYIKQYELYSAMILIHHSLQKDICEVINQKDKIELWSDEKLFISLEIVHTKNKDYIYSILVPSEESTEKYNDIEKMVKKYDKEIDAYYIGTYDIRL